MRSKTDRTADKALLSQLAEDLSVSASKRLRRDPCGDWILNGRRGRICSDGESWFVHLDPTSARAWNIRKRELGRFLVLVQDGDDEGALRGAGTPSAELAELIRRYAGLSKVNPLSDAQAAELRSRLQTTTRTGAQAAR